MRAEAARGKAGAAALWSAVDAGGRQAIQFFVSIVLARLLSPAEFGLMGIVLFFTAVAQSLVDSGFGPALVERREITEADKSSVLFFNVAAGAAMATGLFCAAPWIGSFYGESSLVPLVRFSSLTVFLASCGAVQGAILTRELDFKTQSKANVIAACGSGAVAIVLALTGYGVWSLAVQAALFTGISTVLIWTFSAWRPVCLWRLSSLRSMFGFGSRLLADYVLTHLFERVHLMVIGKAFSTTQLGHYSRAWSTQQVPANVLSSVVARVAFPVFAGVRGDPAALERSMRSALRGMAVVSIPVLLGIAAAAGPIVETLFGPQWRASVPYLRLLAFAGFFAPLQAFNLSVLTALGRSGLLLRVETVRKLMIAASIALTFTISVTAMIWGMLATAVFCYLLDAYCAGLLTGYGIRRQLRDLAPYAAAGAGMACVVWPAPSLLAAAPVPAVLAFQVSLGCATYAALCWVFLPASWRAAVSLAATSVRRQATA